MKNLKFYWHIHHNILLESLTEPLKNRIDYIKRNKPEEEQKLRLKLLKPVRGKLSKKFIEAWKVYNEAWKVKDEAEKVYDEAWKVYNEAWKVKDEAGKVNNEAWKVYIEAEKVYNEARKVYNEAGKVYNEAWKVKKIIALHKKECPNCPWNVKSILTN